MVIKDYKLTLSNLIALVEQLTTALLTNQTLRVNVKVWREKRSLNQNAFQHVCYKEISKYLISKGRKDWTPSKTKDALKNQFLGWLEQEFTDLITGEITVKQALRESSKLDKGDAYQYTTQILDWSESIGLTIKIPVTCEHYKQMAEQNE